PSLSLTSVSGTLVNVNSTSSTTDLGSQTFSGSSLGAVWTLTSLAGDVTALGGGQPDYMIIGPADSSGLYPNANSSVLNFNAHFQKSATFVLSAPGVSGSSVISDVKFSFGTGPDSFAPGSLVPAPSGLVLAPTALPVLGLGYLRRRLKKQAKAA